jgi:chromosome segregation ATPase
MARTHGERLDRLEWDHAALREIVADLARATKRGFDRVAKQSAETGRQIRELKDGMRELQEQVRRLTERMRETDERFRATDLRIEKLVIAIGELVRRNNGRRH